MRCEVCGRRIFGKPQKVLIERAKMTVCENCAKLGSIRWETRAPKLRRKTAKPPLRTLKSRKHTTTLESLELVEDFSLQVRQKREKLGLSHEDLGRKIGEKVSVLRKIEMGKMVPDHRMVNKLEHALQVNLLVPVSENKVHSVAIPLPPREITLGDKVHFKRSKMEVIKKRKPS